MNKFTDAVTKPEKLKVDESHIEQISEILRSHLAGKQNVVTNIPPLKQQDSQFVHHGSASSATDVW